jgi:addiction module RelE/StbE family toxin
MLRLIVSKRAQKDLDEIANYIAQDDLQAAIKVLDEIQHEFEILSEHPNIGQKRGELTTKPYRFLPVYSYLITYRHDQKELRIVRVLSAYRDSYSILH